MNWRKCSDKNGLPEVEGGKDVYLLIKPTIDGLPFMYMSVLWDGINLWIYSCDNNSPWTILSNHIHFDEWAYIEEPKFPADYKRYTIMPDGRKYFNPLNFEHEEIYDYYGLEHAFNVYLDIITHKNATVSCDFIPNLIATDKHPVGYSKVMTYKVKDTDDICFNGLISILKNVIPEFDPEFLSKSKNFYEIEVPKRREEDKQKFIGLRIERFKESMKREPNKEEKERIIKNVEDDMNRFYIQPTISPYIKPELNTLEVFTEGEKSETEIQDFINWLKSFDMHLPMQKLPNGKIREYRNMTFNDWKKEISS